MICTYNTTPENFLQAISLLKTPRYKLILDFLLFLNSKYDEVAVSQQALGRYAGITREHCNRLIKELCFLGLIRKKKRYDNTSLYFINPLFYVFKDKLRGIFRSLNIFSLKLLKSIQKEYITSYILYSSLLFIKAPATYTETITIKQSITQEREKGSVGWVESQKIEKKNKGAKEKAFKKQEKKMESIVISPTLRKITNDLHLTRWGQIKLLVFEEDVLEKTYAIYLVREGIQDAFSWFFGMAKRISETLKKTINWNMFYMLRDRYQMPENPRYTFVEKNIFSVVKKQNPVVTQKATPQMTENKTRFDYEKAYYEFEENYKAGKFAAIEEKLGIKMKNPYLNAMQELNLIPRECSTTELPPQNLNIFSVTL